jgi:hypothetical protein
MHLEKNTKLELVAVQLEAISQTYMKVLDMQNRDQIMHQKKTQEKPTEKL